MVARDHGSACLNDDVGAGLAGVAMNRAGEAVLRGDHRPVIGAYANACGVVHSSGYPSTDSNSSR